MPVRRPSLESEGPRLKRAASGIPEVMAVIEPQPVGTGRQRQLEIGRPLQRWAARSRVAKEIQSAIERVREAGCSRKLPGSSVWAFARFPPAIGTSTVGVTLGLIDQPMMNRVQR
jgi:hypothetical protein